MNYLKISKVIIIVNILKGVIYMCKDKNNQETTKEQVEDTLMQHGPDKVANTDDNNMTEDFEDVEELGKEMEQYHEEDDE